MESRPIQCGSRCRPKNCTPTDHQHIVDNPFSNLDPIAQTNNNSVNHITQTESSPDYTPSPLLPGRDTRSALHKDSKILQKKKKNKKQQLRTLGDRCQIPSTLVACTDLRNFKPQKAWPKKRIPKFLQLFGQPVDLRLVMRVWICKMEQVLVKNAMREKQMRQIKSTGVGCYWAKKTTASYTTGSDFLFPGSCPLPRPPGRAAYSVFPMV